MKIGSNAKIQKMTNPEFITELMEGSLHVYGGIGHAIIIQALQTGLQTMHDGRDELLAQHEQGEKEGKVSLINIPTWVDATEDILIRFNQKYGMK